MKLLSIKPVGSNKHSHDPILVNGRLPSLPAPPQLRRNWNTTPLRQRADRFRKFHAFLVHHKLEDVATSSTPKAMPQALFVDGERRCLLAMERAKANPTAATTLQVYHFANGLQRVSTTPYFIDETWWVGHSPLYYPEDALQASTIGGPN
jgi:hypothetical protein